MFKTFFLKPIVANEKIRYNIYVVDYFLEVMYMSKVAILTDSNSGVAQAEAAQLGVFVVPMPFFIDGEQFLEGINLTQEEFYEKLQNDADISTSQPSIGELQDWFDKLLKEYDEVVFIPMSSGLSGTCQTATMLSEDYDGRVQVVNNQRISVTQRQSVLDAKLLASKGYDAAGIKEILERDKMESSIYITLETLKYLKKGGRITPAAAAIGTVLNLKPVLQIQGEKLDSFAKARGKQAAKNIILKAVESDLETRFAESYKAGRVHLEAAYAGNEEEAEAWATILKDKYPQLDFHMSPLSLSVACHIGYGAIAAALTVYIPEDDSK